MLRTITRTLTLQVVSIPLGIATGVLTARFLGPHDRGLLTLLVLVPRTATILTNIGIDTASIYLHKREQVSLNRLTSNALAYCLLISVPTAVIVWTGREFFLDRFAPGVDAVYLILPILTIPFLFLVQYFGGVLRATGDFATYNHRNLFESIATVAGLFIALVVFKAGLLSCLIVMFAIPVLISGWLAYDLRQHFSRPGWPDIDLLKRTFRFGIKSYAQHIASHAHVKLDLYLIAFYLTSAELAFYSIGVGLAERALMIPNALTMVMYPKLVSIDRAEAARLTAKACRNMLAVGACCAVAILLTGRILVRGLYGVEYLPAVTPTYILMLGVMFVGVTRVLLRFMTSIDMHQYNGYIILISAVVNLLMNIVLIPQYGIRGAAVSSLITYSMQAVMATAVFVRLSGLSVRETLVLRGADLQNWRERLRHPRGRNSRRASEFPAVNV